MIHTDCTFEAHVCRDRESLEVFRWLTLNTTNLPAWETIHLNVPGFHQALTDAVTGQKAPASAMDEIKPVVQAFLNEVYDQ